MKRFELVGHGVAEYPDPLPLVEGRHETEFDADPSRMTQEQTDAAWRRVEAAYRSRGLSGDEIDNARGLPLGVNSWNIPDGARIVEVEEGG